IECLSGKTGKYYTQTSDFIEVITPIENNATKEIRGAFLISAPTADIIEGERSLSRTVLLLQIVLTFAIVAVSFYASSILVRPFRKVTDYLNSGTDFLAEDLSMPDYTETEMLAKAYNQMRHHLKEQEESRQQFVSNVSHELKTPMTSMKVLSDSLIQQAQVGEVPNEMYEDFMIDISHEIDRENKIITDLLELVKMDRKSTIIHIEDTNINDLINLILKRLRPIAEKQQIDISLESYKPIIAQVDRTKLTLAISNLIENGIKYNKEKGWVHVSLNVDNTYFYIKVEDSGIGIPKEDQDHIFERFY
ncbi:MAG TPA: two-component sensor histidine kinase, partial [Lachnospiraceae bacterium]|nr:two-component sensor histidine kinase [Lachnospiraceae bacterium]